MELLPLVLTTWVAANALGVLAWAAHRGALTRSRRPTPAHGGLPSPRPAGDAVPSTPRQRTSSSR